jgi:predicted nucleotidyltransferase
MTTQEAIAVLLANREALVARGVRHAAVFGSVARGESRPDSELDILIRPTDVVCNRTLPGNHF